MKTCSSRQDCLHPDGPVLPESEFYRDSSQPGGLKSRCKRCFVGGTGRRVQQYHTPSLIHLKRLREMVAAMSEAEYREALHIRWIPRLDDLDTLLDPDMRQRDRVARIIVMFKRDCSGDSPSEPIIGGVLGISRQSVNRYCTQLVAHGEATYELQNTFRLKGVRVTHPLLGSRIPA